MPRPHRATRRIVHLGCILTTLMLGSCTTAPPAEDSATATSDACDDIQYDVSWTDIGRPFFKTYCTACHSVDAPERFDAPESCNFDTEEDVITWAERIEVRVLDEGTMPVGGGVPEEDLELLRVYLECGLP